MALGTGGVCPVLDQLFPEGGCAAHVRIDGGHVVGRRRRSVVEEFIHYVNSPNNRRGVHAIRRGCQKTAMPKDSTARFMRENYLAEMIPLEPRHSVVLCQFTIQKTVIGGKKLARGEVFLEDMPEEMLGLLAHGFLQVIPVIAYEVPRWRHLADVIEL